MRLLRPTRLDELQKKKNRSKSSVRAKVEHPFRTLKRVFAFDKVNLYLHRKRLAVLGV